MIGHPRGQLILCHSSCVDRSVQQLRRSRRSFADLLDTVSWGTAVCRIRRCWIDARRLHSVDFTGSTVHKHRLKPWQRRKQGDDSGPRHLRANHMQTFTAKNSTCHRSFIPSEVPLANITLPAPHTDQVAPLCGLWRSLRQPCGKAVAIAHTTCSSCAEALHLSCSMCTLSGHSNSYHLPSLQHAAPMQGCRRDVHLCGSTASQRQQWPHSQAVPQPARCAALRHAVHAQQVTGHQLPAAAMCKTQQWQQWGRPVLQVGP